MKLFIKLFFLTSFYGTYAQEVLSIEKAIDIALENNFQVQIAENETIIAKNNNHIGNSGFLPNLSINSSYNKRSTNLDAESLIPEEIFNLPEKSKSNTFYNTISLNYTLFAGMQRIYSLKKLKNIEHLYKNQSKQKIEEIIFQLINKYMEVANKQNEFELNVFNKDISLDRYEKLKELYDLGGINQMELLNAEMDLNNDIINLQLSELEYNSNKRELANIIGIEDTFEVQKNVIFNTSISLNRLDSLALRNNSSLQITKHNNAVAEQNIKIIQSEFYPKILFTSSYFYSDAADNASFMTSSNSNGFEGVISLQFPLFNSNVNRKNLSNAKIEKLNTGKQFEDAKKNISTAIINTYEAYMQGIELIKLITKNLEIVHKNWELSNELYNLGQLSSIEYRESQSKLINMQIELGRLNYSTKIQEYILYQLAGILIEY